MNKDGERCRELSTCTQHSAAPAQLRRASVSFLGKTIEVAEVSTGSDFPGQPAFRLVPSRSRLTSHLDTLPILHYNSGDR
ncbi:hypothetical protein J6590_036949 [Homalodisca vitripennis]|nr:hypothetical protein J6590_036949 [Homalodisca vitripennis]